MIAYVYNYTGRTQCLHRSLLRYGGVYVTVRMAIKYFTSKSFITTCMDLWRIVAGVVDGDVALGLDIHNVRDINACIHT